MVSHKKKFSSTFAISLLLVVYYTILMIVFAKMQMNLCGEVINTCLNCHANPMTDTAVMITFSLSRTHYIYIYAGY